MKRTREQRQQDARDRRNMVGQGIPVAVPASDERFTGALCTCGAVIVLDLSWLHLRSGVVECGNPADGADR